MSRMRLHSDPFKAGFLGLLTLALILGTEESSVLAQTALPPPVASLPAPPPPAYGLQDCVRMGLDLQPALAAQRASLASANTQAQGLNSLFQPPLIGRSLPIRRQQACLGIAIAQAGLDQAEWETVYAVTRMYFTVLYARAQRTVVDEQITRLQFYFDRLRELVESGETRGPNLTKLEVDKIALHLALAKTQKIEADQGQKRALAALGEAIGVEPGKCYEVVGELLPHEVIAPCCGDLVALALSRRGEMVQVTTVSRVVELEIGAQSKSYLPVVRTFAAGSDIHARPVPQGHANREYWPGATGLEMPTVFAGPRWARVQRAQDLSARAAAVVEKTRNLIVLETEDAYLKWQDATVKLPDASAAVEAGKRIVKANEEGFRKAAGATRIEDILTSEGDYARATATYNETLYQQAIELAALQRVTAGGFEPCFGITVAVQH
jgi:outer membrane protein TolC